MQTAAPGFRRFFTRNYRSPTLLERSSVRTSYRLQIDRNFERENRRTSKETDNAVDRGGLIGDLRAVCSDVDDLPRFSGQT